MSSFTVTFSETSSVLETTFFPPLLLSSHADEWEVCLLDMTTYNSIANILQDVNDEFMYEKDGHSTVVDLPSGAYEIEDINTYLQNCVGGGADTFTLHANNNTLKTELKCVYPVLIDYTLPTIMPLLGFTKQGADKRRLEPNIWHVSDETVDIIKVNVVQVKCNIVHGSYKDGINDHILHTFYPTVPPGFKIVEKPTNLVYLPVNVNRIDTIRISLVDQDDNIIDFRDEEITIRLHLRKRSSL